MQLLYDVFLLRIHFYYTASIHISNCHSPFEWTSWSRSGTKASSLKPFFNEEVLNLAALLDCILKLRWSRSHALHSIWWREVETQARLLYRVLSSISYVEVTVLSAMTSLLWKHNLLPFHRSKRGRQNSSVVCVHLCSVPPQWYNSKAWRAEYTFDEENHSSVYQIQIQGILLCHIRFFLKNTRTLFFLSEGEAAGFLVQNRSVSDSPQPLPVFWSLLLSTVS